MSGIMGIYYLDGRPVTGQDLRRMVDTLAHRGPDRADTWVNGCVGFGHRMLWTTSESFLEKLPLVHPSKKFVITSDARIDNRQELISALQLTNFPSEKITDSQLILGAYLKWGERCPEYLLGDFAFTIWDEREQKLFCARDHFGIKPFYYHYSKQLFTFASEVKALLCVPKVPRLLNEVRVGDYLASELEDEAVTFYQDIFRLPAACSMVINSVGLKIKCYWSLNPERELILKSDQEYAEKFREIFAEAVRCRLRSAFPIGSMLSGGLDSSSITCMARKILTENGQKPLHSYSAVFDEVPKSDERAYIQAVLGQGEIIGHFFHGDTVSPLSDIDKVFWHQDEPILGFNSYINWNINRLAKSHNVRVMLDGFDGDNVVSHGVGYLAELAVKGRWLSLCQETHGFARNFDFSFRQALWPYVKNYVILKHVRKHRSLSFAYKLWHVASQKEARSKVKESSENLIFNTAFFKKMGIEERSEELMSGRNVPLLNQRHHHYITLTSGALPYTLEILDRSSAAFGIEQRYPFWDKRLVEFCLSLPANQKMSQGWTRAVLRRGMEGILPREIQWRGGKANLAHSFDYGMLKFERQRLEKIVTFGANSIEEYVQTEAVSQACQRFIEENANDDDAIITWKALNLALWLNYTGLHS
ncbi:MAG: lasso peptide isopeptide bond-forming cyclase [Scytonematopsis contorta HA4267-MV1]|jgi:asparagine synthase (glutamine-hydrolysing)|nr:lasso peptide isopeptide bond-forming cyclase [Scytonematopsis contorta HA4267-MV1]